MGRDTQLLRAPGLVPIAGGRSAAVEAGWRDVGGRRVGWFQVDGGKHHGAIGGAEADVIERLVKAATAVGVPIVGVLSTSGAEITEGVAALHHWGRVTRAAVAASGVVPIMAVVTGPCVSGASLLLGIADLVVMTADAFAYVCGPAAVATFIGHEIDSARLGGAAVHARHTGVASVVVSDTEHALEVVAELLSYLPSNNVDEAPAWPPIDSPDRLCTRAASIVPAAGTSSYDVKHVLTDVVDADSFFELRPRFAPNLVTGFARLDGRSIGVVANQPSELAGTLHIEASQKGAAFVQLCDAFNVPLLTFVDTPGYQPGKDLEWRGIIRHGAQLVHAYADAKVPRLSVILRKAYGGAYIVMDSKTLGNDYCCAWPQAEVAVMGASGAVAVLHGRRLAGIEDEVDREIERAALEQEYEQRYSTPHEALERGYIDEIIDPLETRHVLVDALRAWTTKRELLPRRQHSNIPL